MGGEHLRGELILLNVRIEAPRVQIDGMAADRGNDRHVSREQLIAQILHLPDPRELLEDLEGLSDKLHLEVKDFVRDEVEAKQLGITRIPAIVLSGQNKGKVRFFGVPAGYEFSTLVEDLMTVSSGEPELLDSTKQALDALQQDLHIQVFVTPT